MQCPTESQRYRTTSPHRKVLGTLLVTILLGAPGWAQNATLEEVSFTYQTIVWSAAAEQNQIVIVNECHDSAIVRIEATPFLDPSVGPALKEGDLFFTTVEVTPKEAELVSLPPPDF